MTRLRRAAGLLLALLSAALIFGPALAGPLRAVCIADRALLAPGERAAVTLVTDAPSGADIQISWSADGGALAPAGGAGDTIWSPPAHAHGVFVIRARVRAGTADAGESADCSAVVAVAEAPNRGGGEPLISLRALLLPTAREAPDYGLYSYVLFAARPVTEQDVKLFDAILKSYLGLLPTQDALESRFPQDFPHPRLNVAYVPIKKPLPDDFDQREFDDQFDWIRSHYDYDRAFAFLTRLRELPDADPSLRSGTVWIVSCQRPLGGNDDPRPGFQQNLTAVPVDLIPYWMRIFASQTVQPRDYSPHTIALLAFDLRVAIAQAAQGLQTVTAAITSLGGAR